MQSPLILPLTARGLTLETAGGKGTNLSTLIQQGFPVPPGFVVTTAAYNAYVAANTLDLEITRLVQTAPLDDPVALEEISLTIRLRFDASELAPDLSYSLLEMYGKLGRPPVAVRSSATVEDLPDLSFAGQQDTFLNVVGDQALLDAMVRCWSSLWTARAISYRIRHGVAQRDLALAVVVQSMVDSDVSGVLFTANPLTGKRNQTVIEATFGLGELLVSGQVEPDRYVVDRRGHILERRLGQKESLVRSEAGGGTTRQAGASSSAQALPDEAIGTVAQLGHRIAESMGSPQDIEWARAGDSLYILQSRPITSLFPLPTGIRPEPLRVMFSFGAVQGVLEPMTPLGQYAIQAIFAGAAKLFGEQRTAQTQEAVRIAAERLFIDCTGLVRHRIWRRVFRGFLGIAEPGISKAMESLWDDARLVPDEGFGPRTARQIGPVLLPMLGRLILTMLRPDAQRRHFEQQLDDLESAYTARFSATRTLDERLDLMEELLDRAFQFLLPQFVPRFAAGMVGLNILSRLAASLPHHTQNGTKGQRPNTLAMMRGLPHNVTTEMDLALWETAQVIQTDATSRSWFLQMETHDLAEQYLASRLPEPAQSAIARFLARYGMRGLAEIDLGRPRWREKPKPVMQTLQTYVEIEKTEQAPDVVFRRAAASASAMIDKLIQEIRSESGGRIKARLAMWAAQRMRTLAGLRESPKFWAVRMMGLVRESLLQSGQELVAAGHLAHATDLFCFRMGEIRDLARGEDWPAWRTLARQRREAYKRETFRKQIPRLLLSDGTAYYEGVYSPPEADGRTLTGSPVSPGVATGTVRVVLDPHSAQVKPGEILVCPGTDPAWTPLFLVAGGLVMEVGGLMTHGSVVAREYGIPAVVGVDQATTRLETGQSVRVDGTTGQVTLL
ncbi:MAG: PEP/pyruvate-binding domain-containing protein [Anaerolineae bacterium]